jgi:hypothetical protein
MKAERHSRLTLLLVPSICAAFVGFIACSSPEPDAGGGKNEVACNPKKEDCDDDKDDKKKTTKSADEGDDDRPQSPPPSTNQSPDASTDAKAPPPAPPPTTKNCQDLSSCCASLTDFADKIACIGVSLAKNETGCGAALTVCKAGGVGIGGLFGGSHPNCNELSKCCKTFQTQGYAAEANYCADWVKTEDEDLCQEQLFTYQDFGDCL